MKYIMLVYSDEKSWRDEEREQCYKDSAQVAGELQAQGKLLAANPLHSVSTATSVRVRDDRRMVTDGPFAETREQLGGYFLIDAADLDEAISFAARLPSAKKGVIEIRPVLDISRLADAHPG